MKTSDFYFDLPEELIAQSPAVERDKSRLMVLNKDTGDIRHRVFSDILEYLNKGDCLVLNDTRVIPARIFGTKDTGAVVEFLLLRRIDDNKWQTLVKPGKRAKVGSKFTFGNGELMGEITDIAEEGTRIIHFSYDGIFEEVLDKLGNMPLPPYITKELEDKERYQTVYSKHRGSAAAPTAGLHFTNELLKQIEDKGVKIVYITLHVGLGTFRPVKVEKIEEHEMHSEFYMVSKETAETINQVKKSGGKIITVGTTATRTIETVASSEGLIKEGNGWTNIFIYPGYKFKAVDNLLTNFHLPESTLLMLISALAGRDKIMKAYESAVENRYRFFSFGDAMLIIGGKNEY